MRKYSRRSGAVLWGLYPPRRKVGGRRREDGSKKNPPTSFRAFAFNPLMRSGRSLRRANVFEDKDRHFRRNEHSDGETTQ